MSEVELNLEGLDELIEALYSLPAELTGEAGHIVEGKANQAVLEIKRGYPVRSGKLRDGVEAERDNTGPLAVGYIVRSRNQLAWLFENGSQARHTEIGANRGSMPAGHVFEPIVARKRREMYVELKELLARHGLAVSGDE